MPLDAHYLRSLSAGSLSQEETVRFHALMDVVDSALNLYDTPGCVSPCAVNVDTVILQSLVGAAVVAQLTNRGFTATTNFDTGTITIA